MGRSRTYWWPAAVVAGLLLGSRLPAQTKKANERIKEIAGTSEFLRSVPKHFATLKGIDAGKRQVTLQMEGEKEARTWSVTPDAEIRVAGWWGRLDQLTAGDRVWVWLKTGRDKKPVAVFMLADEPSEQDIHEARLNLTALENGTLTVRRPRGKGRTLKAEKTTGLTAAPGIKEVPLSFFKKGARIYLQSAGDRARLLMDDKAFEARRKHQQAELRKRWEEKGLPGTVTFLHLSGEMELMLDHEGMRWGRSLKPGDKVTLVSPGAPIPAVVKIVQPWRERTQLRLVVKGQDLADLAIGRRVGLRMAAPPPEVENSPLPPDLGRRTDRKERIEWFLASIYCPCGVGNNTCTGDFYTLASCNPNGCGMPNRLRRQIGEKIDKGLTDKQIFEELLKEYGPHLLRQHLRP